MKTIYYTQMAIAREAGVQYVPMDHSTLNEVYDILQNQVPGPNQYLDINYYGIGRGGHRELSNRGNMGKAEHDAIDAAFFEHIPFAVKCLTDNEDFNSTDRAKYRLREVRTINGKLYALYWLKKLDLTAGSVTIEKIHVDSNTGIPQITNYTPVASQLKPQPTFPEPGVVVPSSGTKVTVRLTVEEVLDANDLKMIMEASELIYGNKTFAQISEIGIVGGIDKQHQAEGNNGAQITYTELSTATICSFIRAMEDIDETSGNITLKIEMSTTNNLSV